MSKLTCLVSIFIFLVSCNKKESTSTNVESTSDLVLASSKTAVDEAVDSIVETGSTSSFSPMSVEFSPLTTTLTKACTNTDGTHASVLVTFSGQDSLSFSKGTGSPSINVTMDVLKSGTETRLWTPAQCDGGGTYAAIDWSSTGASNTLNLAVTLNRSIARSKNITVTKLTGAVVNKTSTDDVSVTGTRNITWATPILDGATHSVSRVKTITSSVTRDRTFTRANGASLNLVSTVTVASGTPLVVTVVRDNNATPKALISKTINSGTVTVTETDGSYSSCAFSDVKYDFVSNTDKCLPVSGSIQCEKFDSSTASTPASTLNILFGQSTTSTVSISTDNGVAEDYSDYNSKGCDLETAI